MCVEEVEGTCPAGGMLEATMTLKEAALFANVETKATITSPAVELTVGMDVNIEGGGRNC